MPSFARLRTFLKENLTGRRGALFWIVFGACFLSLKGSQYLFTMLDSAPAIISAFAGIALASVLLFGFRMLVPIGLAQFLAALSNPMEPPFWLVLLATVMAVLQAAVMTLVLKRFRFTGKFERMREAWIFLVATFIFAALGPLVLSTARVVLGATTEPLWDVFSRGWAGGVLSYLIFTPLLTVWLPWKHARLTRQEYIEVASAFGALIAVNLLIFWIVPLPPGLSVFLIYALLAALAWIALRLGTKSMTAALFLTLCFGVIGTILFPHPTQALAQRLFSVEIFIELIAVIFIAFMAVTEERRKATRELEDTVAKLHASMAEMAQADRAKNEFIAILAHELRNPLAPVMSTLELLKFQERNPDSVKLIETAESQTHLMRRLLDDLLDVARVAQQKFRLQKESTDLGAMLRRSVAAVRHFAESKGQSIAVELPEGVVPVYVDPVRFEQIVTNLLNNSVKYTQEGGEIRLKAGLKKDRVVVSVQDNGMGITPEELKEIFLPFKQMQRSTPHQGTGLGIGLSLTKRLVEMHGGTIEARSDGMKRGSTFTVTIPLEKTADAPVRPRKHHASAGGLRVLIIDDNRAAADGLARLLALKGHTVRTGYDGSSAPGIAAEFNPHAVLLDIGLPDVDGYDVAVRLRGMQDPEKPMFIVALTGYGQESDKQSAQEAGFDYHITKPARIAEIEAILGDA